MVIPRQIINEFLRHGIRDCGDGTQRGIPLACDEPVLDLVESSDSIKLECQPWRRMDGGARRKRDESKHLTRLHLLKELFNVFLNRAVSLNPTLYSPILRPPIRVPLTPPYPLFWVSLLVCRFGVLKVLWADSIFSVSNRASEDQELTPIFENFRQQLDRKEAGGDTAIYEALDSARRMLTQYRPDLPGLRKRIIIVSDGEDTSSTTSAQEVCLALQRAKVVVDSVQVGPTSDPILHSISVATGTKVPAH